MVCDVHIVGIQTIYSAYPSHRIGIKWKWAFMNTSPICFIGIGIIDGSWTNWHTCNTIWISIGSQRTQISTSSIDILAKEQLGDRTLRNAPPSGIIPKQWFWTLPYTHISTIICKVSIRAHPNTIPSSNITIGSIGAHPNTYPCIILRISTLYSTVTDINTYFQASSCYIVSIGEWVIWALWNTVTSWIITICTLWLRADCYTSVC